MCSDMASFQMCFFKLERFGNMYMCALCLNVTLLSVASALVALDIYRVVSAPNNQFVVRNAK